jgi:hypothetical protein
MKALGYYLVDKYGVLVEKKKQNKAQVRLHHYLAKQDEQERRYAAALS